MKKFHPAGLTLLFMLSLQGLIAQTPVTRTIASFDKDWRFHLGDAPGANAAAFDDATWRNLALPHDWSIEGKFDKDNPAGTGGGALPGGVGWYRKTFTVPASSKGRHVFIDFDGIYRKSEVWINGHSLGMRPNGYISFRYELTPFLKYGGEKNCIAVRVDNSQQPNSRWYSGSGIYRNVWLVTTGGLFVDHWGTYITTPKIDDQSATIAIRVRLDNPQAQDRRATVRTTINDAEGGSVGSVSSEVNAKSGSVTGTAQAIDLKSPRRWSLDDPYLYRAVTEIFTGGKLVDSYETFIGIR
ncbi:MAG: glycoside hydrolase family 2, partial [Bacteroidota bacterium]|nr:glycoside hydrolase family 2 [Bacteroidota bacterium]